jgi:hypothetical protein
MQAGKRSKALSLFRQAMKDTSFSEVNTVKLLPTFCLWNTCQIKLITAVEFKVQSAIGYIFCY